MARMAEVYKNEVVPALMQRFQIKNVLAVPKLEKITVNMGLGQSLENAKRLEVAQEELAIITGQRPVIRKARKSVAGFKVRQGMPIGLKVTLRKRRMYEFYDRLVSVAIPRIRDFQGFPSSSFDGRGNYSIGLSEQTVFPEVNIDTAEFVQGMDITLTIRNSDDERSRVLLEMLGFPFRR